MNNIVVIINGKGGSGKDLFILKFKKLVENINLHVYNISSIDAIKSIVESFGCFNDKSEKGRKFLSDIKKVSIEYCNFPTNNIIEKIKRHIRYFRCYTSVPFISFVHIREPEEIKKLVRRLKRFKNLETYTLLIRRHVGMFGNTSDDNVENYNYDYAINNDKDIENLKKEAKLFYDFILEETNN